MKVLNALLRRDDLACVGHDPELWFPRPDAPRNQRVDHLASAGSICDTCSAAGMCHAAALEQQQRYRVEGMWGGLDFTPRPGRPTRDAETAGSAA